MERSISLDHFILNGIPHADEAPDRYSILITKEAHAFFFRPFFFRFLFFSFSFSFLYLCFSFSFLPHLSTSLLQFLYFSSCTPFSLPLLIYFCFSAFISLLCFSTSVSLHCCCSILLFLYCISVFLLLSFCLSPSSNSPATLAVFVNGLKVQDCIKDKWLMFCA